MIKWGRGRNEDKLAVRIQRGEPDAFDELFDCYADRVLGFCLRLTGNRVEAEDLVQEVFVAAFATSGISRQSEACSRFEARSSLLTWLLGIAVRRWRDGKRRHTLQTTSLHQEESAWSVASTDSGPEERALGVLTVEQALGVLEAPQRAALLLVASQGLTYREAAEVLGEPVGTVKWRVAEAMKKMRNVLAQDEEEGIDGMQAHRAKPLPCTR